MNGKKGGKGEEKTDDFVFALGTNGNSTKTVEKHHPNPHSTTLNGLGKLTLSFQFQ